MTLARLEHGEPCEGGGLRRVLGLLDHLVGQEERHIYRHRHGVRLRGVGGTHFSVACLAASVSCPCARTVTLAT